MNFFSKLLIATAIVAMTSIGVSLWFVLNFPDQPYFIILGGIWGVTLFLLLYYEFINKHVVEITEAIGKISAGDFKERLSVHATDPVLGKIEKGINIMAEKLEEKYKWQESLVSEQAEKIKKEAEISAEQNKDLEESKIAMINLVEDIEKEKDLTIREKNRAEAILYSIGDGVFVLDKKLTVLIFNKAASVISGFLEEDVVGKRYDSVLKFVYEKTGEVNNVFIKNVFETGKNSKMSNHTILYKKDGSKVPISDSVAPVKDEKGNIVGCVVVFHDATREREVDKAKTEFVSLASHQLRTPLSTVNWYTEMLMAGDAGELNGEQKKYLEEVYRGNQRMVELVNALLNVSRLDLGTFVVECKPTDIAELARSVVSEQKPYIDQKEIVFSSTYGKDIPLMQIDPKFLRMIIQNILSNAVKYTPEKGKVRLSITLDDDKNAVLLKVSDTGYGIPREQQDKVFTKLFRADNVREKDTEGTGLGLYLVKAIVNTFRGHVWFESEENKGTTVYVILPLVYMEKKKRAGVSV